MTGWREFGHDHGRPEAFGEFQFRSRDVRSIGEGPSGFI